MQEMGGLTISTGDPGQMGTARKHEGYNFAVSVPDGEPADLLLYRSGSRKPEAEIPLPEAERTGQVSAVCVKGLEPGKWEYNYRIGGKVVPDPYVKILRKAKGTGKGEERRGVLESPSAAVERPLEIPYGDCVIYKTHVRGFTMRSGSGVRHRGTFLGVQEKIPYLKKLGVTTLMLMPVYEFRELPPKARTGAPEETPAEAPALDPEAVFAKPAAEDGQAKAAEIPRKNYWGYTDGLYFAPRALYCATDHPSAEFAAMMDALHRAGIECVLEFYFRPELPARTVLDILHYWRLNYQVDGFHLLGEGSWIGAVMEDPLLKKSKLFYLHYENDGLTSDGKAPYYRNLGELNLGYEEQMRRFLKGDPGCLEGAAWYMRRNSEGCGYVNYFADQDGFTMADMVSYEQKHNEKNGERNRDGSNSNYTWNCGLEGPARKSGILKLRNRQLKNAFLLLLTSQGTPMIYGGDEFLNSQEGNNNAWCQDNETGWLDWKKTKAAAALQEFVRRAIEFRREHPVLHGKRPLRLMDYKACGCPDLSYHGERAWFLPMDGGGCSLGALYCGQYAKKADGTSDDSIYLACNMHWEPFRFALPDLPEGQEWKIKADTGTEEGIFPDGEEKTVESSGDKSILVPPRTVMILIGK